MSPILTENIQRQITKEAKLHQYADESVAGLAPKSGLSKSKHELIYFLPDTQIPSHSNPSTNRTYNSDHLLFATGATITKANMCQNTVQDLDSLLPDTQIGVLESNFVPTSNALSLDHSLPDTQRNSLSEVLQADNATLGDNILLPYAQRNFSLKDPASSGLPSTPLFLLEDDERLPETQGPSASQHLFTYFSSNTSKISAKTELLQSDEKSKKLPLNRISCKERKRLAVSNTRPPSLTKAMRRWIAKTHALLDAFREDDDCWLHPSPPCARPSSAGIPRPCGKITKTFVWQDHIGKHSLRLNYGIASKLANHKMNKQQKDGFINKQWHLSHLCGNWTCLNPAHTTVEPGNINLSRNNCFSHRSGCLHTPPCMKDKKVPLGPDGKLVDHSGSVIID